ncbi:hypothetical protein BDB01DRAFT_224552 [Pilobolus umbonatus]|nr:hypothetical protein BDB01DRAFT_224552 [Pilobolus umbonatus]
MDEHISTPTIIKNQIRALEQRLSIATEKQKKLRQQLIEEDISDVVLSRLTEAINDPTRVESTQLKGLQKQIFDEMMSAAEKCCVQELISYHRLSGVSVFDFKQTHTALRLETFYNRTFKEPYYILFTKEHQTLAQNKIDKHTIPSFIQLDNIAQRFLPDYFDTFIRIVHELVQAYVTRREMMKEIACLTDVYPLEIINENASRTRIELTLEKEDQSIDITILFDDMSSAYPTDVEAKYSDTSEEDMVLRDKLMNEDILKALMEYSAE